MSRPHIANIIIDMGSRHYTPFPYMRTISNLISSPLFFPLTFYMKQQLASRSLGIQKKQQILGKLGFVGMLIIFIGMIFTGIITEDGVFTPEILLKKYK